MKKSKQIRGYMISGKVLMCRTTNNSEFLLKKTWKPTIVEAYPNTYIYKII